MKLFRKIYLRHLESKISTDIELSYQRESDAGLEIENLRKWRVKAITRLRQIRSRLAAVEDSRELLNEILHKR